MQIAFSLANDVASDAELALNTRINKQPEYMHWTMNGYCQ